MPKARITCLRSIVRKGSEEYPVYTGLAPGRQIHLMSLVPSFNREDTNLQIAQRLLEPMEDNWQRPQEEDRVKAIRDLYADVENPQIMVNPVLLGGIPGSGNSRVKIISEQNVTSTADKSLQIVVLEISYAKPADKRAFWVIDGQHRIGGLSNNDQPVPFVLLLDDGEHFSGDYLAELFSIVTTEAKPMKPIHKEWMQYAFSLGAYTDELRKKSMKIALLLATKENFGDGHSNENPFYGQIQFNPTTKPDMSKIGVFGFTISQLVNQIHSPRAFGNLLESFSEDQIASSISDFVAAIKSLHGPGNETSILFGKRSKSKCSSLRDSIGFGLFKSWMFHLSKTSGDFPDYPQIEKLLASIGFGSTDWSLPHSSMGRSQRDAVCSTICNTFCQLYDADKVPYDNLGDYLMGRESTSLELEFAPYKERGKLAIKDKVLCNITVTRGNDDFVIDVPPAGKRKRSGVRHIYARSDDPYLIGGHTPNCRVHQVRVLDEWGREIKYTSLEAFAAIKNKSTGLDLGNGSYAKFELNIVPLFPDSSITMVFRANFE